jgi:transposase
MRAYSIDLRKRVLADCDGGLGTKAVAEKYQVSPAIVRRWKQRRRENGELGPRPWNAGRKRRVDRDAVAAAVRAQPDATLRELREALGIDVSLQTIHRILRELKISFKKKSSTPRSKTAPTSRRSGPTGKRGRLDSTRGGSSSSTKRGRKRT